MDFARQIDELRSLLIEVQLQLGKALLRKGTFRKFNLQCALQTGCAVIEPRFLNNRNGYAKEESS